MWPAAATAAPRPRAFPWAMLISAVSVAAVLVGAVSPWARVPTYRAAYGAAANDPSSGVFRVPGLEAPGMIPLVGDGTVILIMASLAGVLILWRLFRPPRSCGFLLLAIFSLLAVVTLIGMVNWANVGNIPQADSRLFFKSSVEVSWGLIVLCLGAWPGVAAAAYQLWADEFR